VTARPRTSFVLMLALLASLLQLAGPGAEAAPPPHADQVILFSADGMRQDLIHDFRDDLDTFDSLLDDGVQASDDGMLQGFPPNTGVGWATIATGTWPGEHGSTNNTFHRTGATFTGSTSFAGAGILQTDTIAQAAERAGKTVVSMEWVAARGYNPPLQGPVVDFRSFFGRRGVALNFDLPGQPAGANAFNVEYQRLGSPGESGIDALDPAAGWTNVPASFSPAMELTFDTGNTSLTDDRVDVYLYDSTDDATTNYDSALFVLRRDGKDGNDALYDLGANEWGDAKVLMDTGFGSGRVAGFRSKVIELEPDLSRVRVYFTSLARANATYNALGPAGSRAFEDTLNEEFPTSGAADFAPLEAGIIDEDTYVEQGLMWKDAHWAYLQYIVGTAPVPTVDGGTLPGLGVEPDLLMVGNPVTDEFSHQFLALITPTDIDGDPNPYFDDVTNDDVPDGRVDEREGYIRAAYEEADDTLGLARQLVGSDAAAFAMSDHGFAPQWMAVNARRVLWDTQITVGSTTHRLHASGETATSNCGAAATDLAKACWAGGTIQIYVNPTLPTGVTPAMVRNAAVAAFAGLTDPADPDAEVVDEVFLKEELRDVDGTDALHPNRSGDVVVVLRPPYQSDAGTPGVEIAFSQFFGQHGYLPALKNLATNVNMRAAFLAAGPGIKDAVTLPVRAIDVAPTISFLMGIPGPQSARGKILLGMLEGTSTLREVAILDISDYHGQLIPLLEAADFTVNPATGVVTALGPSFGIGGAAFLKPWFDEYRAENPGATITLTAGDAVGATPPISNAFGDEPTIELMNLMGFDLDGLGNHNFDRGEQYLREVLIPLADFPYVSANILHSETLDTPEEWSKSRVFDFGSFRLGIVGFSNEDIPALTKPGALGPFIVTDPVAAVNQRAGQLQQQRGMAGVVAIGHLGASGGNSLRPEPYFASTEIDGPLADLADDVTGVDAVIGDHTDVQVMSPRSNGVLVVENRSKGIRFSRLRLIVDTVADEVVYMTADFHRPWNIGVTPDPVIQARIDQLNAELAPIFNTVVGESTVAVPRGDACAAGTGRTDGRACESLVGNVVTDAMRAENATEFAITNSGGLRDNLTCPTTDQANDFCPPSIYPIPNAAGRFPITRGQVNAVLPFGNVSATVMVTGEELKDYLETAVSPLPSFSNGRFGQVSGLCVTFDVQQPARQFLANGQGVPGTGSRVQGAVRQATDGTCTGAPISFSPSASYSLTINDFMVPGGDGYPNVSGRAHTQDLLEQDVADYLAVQPGGVISPAIQGRVHCTDSDPGAAPACPPGSP
jgi:2',3'-cyclic-nucleotide 2'-phosphodiesterase (5'-nucleotidase family)/predicted AlkP superfamily phosphohydrolase/phosphomutase